MELVNKKRKLKGIQTDICIWFKTGEQTFVFTFHDQTLRQTDASIESMVKTIICDPLYEGDTLTFRL